jgi:hypothetical protein
MARRSRKLWIGQVLISQFLDLKFFRFGVCSLGSLQFEQGQRAS